nr:uncharacterized protein LOC129441715 [Misgurnus anguillicaudatus]
MQREEQWARFQQDVIHPYITGLEKHLHRRFHWLDILGAFSVLGPQSAVPQDNRDIANLQILARKFFPQHEKEVLQEWLSFKNHALIGAFKVGNDFETANLLGSKKGIQKLGGIYFTLRNFPPQFNSSLANVHLCALLHSQDIKTYGFGAILEPNVNDIKILETKGIKGLGGSVRGSIVQVTGDNLGLHCLFVYLESFRARYCCRFSLNKNKDYQNTWNTVKLYNQTLH